MKRIIEIDHCNKCPHLIRNSNPDRLKDTGFNCEKLPTLKKDLGGNHVSFHRIKQYDTEMNLYIESQKGPFPMADKPRDPFMRLWIDNCPLEKVKK